MIKFKLCVYMYVHMHVQYVLYTNMYISVMVAVYAKAWTTERQISLWDSNNVRFVLFNIQ